MDDGTYLPQVQLDWTASSSVFAIEYEVWHFIGYSGTYALHGKTTKVTYKIDAPTITQHNVKIRAVNVGTNVKSEYTDAETLTVVPYTIPALDDFDVVANFSDLAEYPLALRREIVRELANRYDPDAGTRFVPVAVTGFEYGTQPVKDIRVKMVLPRQVSGSQQYGDGVASGNTLTDASHNYVSGAVIGNYLISFTSGDTKDGTEHRITGVVSDGGSGTVFTVIGEPKTGPYYLVSANDI